MNRYFLTFFVILVSGVFSLPFLAIFSSIFTPLGDNFSHIIHNVLSKYVINSLLLVFGVGTISLLYGVICAWLVANYKFPAAHIFRWALILPLVFPAYIVAFVYAGVFEYAGIVQTLLRESLNLQKNDYWFPEIRSVGGAIVVMSSVLYPYIYLLALNYFEKSKEITDIARTLGQPMSKIFFNLSIPAAKTPILVGLLLVTMEVLSEFGTLQFFAVDGFTTAIYKSWFGLNDYNLAIKLSTILLVTVMCLFWGENKLSRKKTHLNSYNKTNKTKLTSMPALSAVIICSIPLFVGFIFPIIQLLIWQILEVGLANFSTISKATINSFALAVIASCATIFIAVVFSYVLRFKANKPLKLLINFSSLGYGVPGTIIAIGFLVSLSWADHLINFISKNLFSTSLGLVLSGTIFALIIAYIFRFLTLALKTTKSGMDKISNEIQWSALLLGSTHNKIITSIHLPIIKNSVVIASLLVFVEVIKELPASLIIRPFNFNTLAIRTYDLVSDERLIEASTPALIIIMVSIIPVMILSRRII